MLVASHLEGHEIAEIATRGGLKHREDVVGRYRLAQVDVLGRARAPWTELEGQAALQGHGLAQHIDDAREESIEDQELPPADESGSRARRCSEALLQRLLEGRGRGMGSHRQPSERLERFIDGGQLVLRHEAAMKRLAGGLTKLVGREAGRRAVGQRPADQGRGDGASPAPVLPGHVRVVEHDALLNPQPSLPPVGRYRQVHPCRKDVGQVVERQRGLVGEDAGLIGPEPDAHEIRVVRGGKVDEAVHPSSDPDDAAGAEVVGSASATPRPPRPPHPRHPPHLTAPAAARAPGFTGAPPAGVAGAPVKPGARVARHQRGVRGRAATGRSAPDARLDGWLVHGLPLLPDLAPDPYIVALLIAGLIVFGAAVVPRMLAGYPFTLPMTCVAAGALLWTLSSGLAVPHPARYPRIAENVTTLAIIVALMGAGIRIDRPFSFQSWGVSWRLLAITMPLTIAAVATASCWILALPLPTAVLLGAVLAPTDPVLAADVQVGPPREPHEDEVRFGLTTEAGLNDGLAFPFVYLAIALAAADGAFGGWLGGWLLRDGLYRIAVGGVVGFVTGRAVGYLLFRVPVGGQVAEAMDGTMALAATLLSYALGELAGGYGFVAVFVAASAVRGRERQHRYHTALHDFTAQIERLLMAALLVLFGGAVAGGLLDGLTWLEAAVSAAVILVFRPAAGLLALAGKRLDPPERWALAFFGIRGVGSFYYLAFATAEERFAGTDRLWRIVAFVVLISIVLHGASATPVMRAIRRRRTGENGRRTGS